MWPAIALVGPMFVHILIDIPLSFYVIPRFERPCQARWWESLHNNTKKRRELPPWKTCAILQTVFTMFTASILCISKIPNCPYCMLPQPQSPTAYILLFLIGHLQFCFVFDWVFTIFIRQCIRFYPTQQSFNIWLFLFVYCILFDYSPSWIRQALPHTFIYCCWWFYPHTVHLHCQKWGWGAVGRGDTMVQIRWWCGTAFVNTMRKRGLRAKRLNLSCSDSVSDCIGAAGGREGCCGTTIPPVVT